MSKFIFTGRGRSSGISLMLALALTACGLPAIEISGGGAADDQQVLRLQLGTDSVAYREVFETGRAAVVWQVTGSSLALTGVTFGNEGAVELDLADAFADAGDTLNLQVSGWLDLDDNELQDPLEPAGQISATVELALPDSEEPISGGHDRYAWDVSLSVSGEGGMGTQADPVQLPIHSWSEVSAYSAGESWFSFRTTEAGRYLMVAWGAWDDISRGTWNIDLVPDGPQEFLTTDNAGDATAAWNPTRIFAADEDILLQVTLATNSNLQRETYRLLAMRIPDVGSNSAHSILSLPDRAATGLEVFSFASATTSEDSNGVWGDGRVHQPIRDPDRIVFTRTKTGAETADPQLEWTGYRDAVEFNGVYTDFSYRDGSGFEVGALLDRPCTGFAVGTPQPGFDDGNGAYIGVPWVITACPVYGGAGLLTGFFQR
jgi:hypothetical protein